MSIDRRPLDELLHTLGIKLDDTIHSSYIESYSPINGALLAKLNSHRTEQVDKIIQQSMNSFKSWRITPAPQRGELIRQFGNKLRQFKPELASLITQEVGKISSEALGEVQEMIDICDFAVGLSRQLYGLTIASERPFHTLRETWHPIGPIGVITAFNFPMAVWAWNATIGLVCGNTILWKPSEKAPLCALACQHLLDETIREYQQDIPLGIAQLVIGDKCVGETLVNSEHIPVISATGSCQMGKSVATQVASRFGRCILELGGNNALIVAPSAKLSQAIPALAFGAAGTAGQRCTTTRRAFIHDSIYQQVLTQLKRVFDQLTIGDPAHHTTLVGPLIDQLAFDHMQAALLNARNQGCIIHGGERVLSNLHPNAWYVKPAIVEGNDRLTNSDIETFAPILYCFPYSSLEEAIQRQNAVPQGLSSAIFTTDLIEAELFMSAAGSDCGIVNVNAGTSGAEIGGAFGGEKATGGGRESGSDAWKGYMRRATNTINYSQTIALAQGVKFDID